MVQCRTKHSCTRIDSGRYMLYLSPDIYIHICYYIYTYIYIYSSCILDKGRTGLRSLIFFQLEL